MKLLALTDFHGSYDKLPAILKKAGEVDATLVAGDLTDFGPAAKAKEVLGRLPRPLLAVPGNCDPKDTVDVLRAEGCNLHENKLRLGEVTFVGIGGANPTPFNTPFELSEDEIAGALERLLHGVSGTAVLLSHAPPKGAQDEIPGGIHVGSTAVAQFAPHFSAIICGHIHEAKGISHLGRTLVVNPGMAADGNAAILEIDGKGHASAILLE